MTLIACCLDYHKLQLNFGLLYHWLCGDSVGALSLLTRAFIDQQLGQTWRAPEPLWTCEGTGFASLLPLTQ